MQTPGISQNHPWDASTTMLPTQPGPAQLSSISTFITVLLPGFPKGYFFSITIAHVQMILL